VSEPFNPLDMQNLAHSIVTRMVESDATPLGSVPVFNGAGVYAIYYRGDFTAYSPLAAENDEEWAVPIYVGKAVPSGGRRGLDVGTHETTRTLSSRIRQHARSVQDASNLAIEDFAVQWLTIQDIWIPLGESALIRRHRPVWNALVDGFGNHDPGSGRSNGVRSRWDTLHPGRSWAIKYPARDETPFHISQDIAEYLRSRL
jgi:hypothetical protein